MVALATLVQRGERTQLFSPERQLVPRRVRRLFRASRLVRESVRDSIRRRLVPYESLRLYRTVSDLPVVLGAVVLLD